ncbi:MAG: replication initiation protein [Lamprobacter sp.]|uniref:replication initiation protein n=1 Tax=Lamprobacter sp. TaxID=3100796 RepID=UPI002B2637E9|nr:replication initiation protein [Lamprobacter sp.]MEA3642270.1 replication initiation protein [Lamprobacter sp.]
MMRELTCKAEEQLLKPTATVHVGNRLSLIERKVFNALIWHFQRHQGKTDNQMSVNLLMSLIGLGRSKNMDVIKEALEQLTTTAIIWNSLKQDRTTNWGVCTFLAGAELCGGQLRYVLNPLLVDKVQNPTLFAKIQLLIQTQFSSKYALALYEFLIDDLCRAGSPKTHSLEVSLDTLRHVLQFDGPYKHLNADVLKPCLREINQHADIDVRYQAIKSGRSVAAIRFVLERKAVQLMLGGMIEATVEADANGDPPIEDITDPLITALIAQGVGLRKAKALVAAHDEERIRGNLAHAVAEHKAGKVKNFAAYLVRAIEEDYRPMPEPPRQPSEPSPRLAARQAQEQLKADWERFRSQRVRERFAALTEAEQEAHRAAFVERLQHGRSILLKPYRRDGFKSPMVEAQFFAELSESLLQAPEELNLQAFQSALSRGA